MVQIVSAAVSVVRQEAALPFAVPWLDRPVTRRVAQLVRQPVTWDAPNLSPALSKV